MACGRQWIRIIDKHIRRMLPDGKSPLVPAGLGTLFPLCKGVNNHPHLMDKGIPGNPEGLSPYDLHQRAWPIVGPVFKMGREGAYARYRQLAGTGKTVTDIAQAVLATHYGGIEVLFVAAGVQVWRPFDRQEDKLCAREFPELGGQDLLDLLAIQILLKGGAVHAVLPEEVPDQDLVAAILSY